MHDEFKVYKLNSEGIIHLENCTIAFDELLSKLEKIVPTGRELSIVKTKLEEACFFAKKGISKSESNQHTS